VFPSGDVELLSPLGPQSIISTGGSGTELWVSRKLLCAAVWSVLSADSLHSFKPRVIIVA